MKFLRELLASCLGSILAVFVLGGLVYLAVRLFSPDDPEVKSNSVLKISLDKPIPELTNNLPVGPLDFGAVQSGKLLGLHDMLAAIEHAQSDDDIKGIYLEINTPMLGMASAELLRRELETFRKESGKFVLSYSDQITQGGLFLAASADEVYLNPQGVADFLGLSAEVTYFKNMLDKIGIRMQVFYAGKFKSATEPYRRTDMSEANRLQLRVLLEGMYSMMLEEISKGRSISTDSLRQIANQALVIDANDALKYNFVDELYYRDQVLDELRKRLGTPDDEDIESVDIATYHSITKETPDLSIKQKVAVVVAEGTIIGGEGAAGEIGGRRYAKVIRDLRKDDKVKAIVLRVNSGGGSAFASEEIWRELTQAKADGKVVVTSFGDVAASGGYYIAAPSDKIFAQRRTITGSIGIFGVIPNVREFTENKLGVTLDTVRTGKFSAMNPLYYDFSEEEAAMIQNQIDKGYTLFKSRVAEGRGLSMEQVDSIAQGRVWLGTDAKKVGLIDEFGDLDAAVAAAAELAGLEKYRRSYYPEIKSPFEALLEQLGGKAEVNIKMPEQLGPLYEVYQQKRLIESMKGPQARMPYSLRIK